MSKNKYYPKDYTVTKTCETCNQEFTVDKFHLSQKVCSDSCRNIKIKKYWRERYKPVEKRKIKTYSYGYSNCIICGSDFIKQKHDHRFCSKYCSTKYHNEKKKDKNKKCVTCGKTLDSRKNKYCSDKCTGRLAKEKNCIVCGSKFKRKNNSKTCSIKCSEINKKIYLRNRDKTIVRRLRSNINVRIYESLKLGKECNSLNNLLGYSMHDLKSHLENQFDANMTWDNYGDYWHIDHILPLSFFNPKSVHDLSFKLCWNLVNLQPLEAKKNLQKNNSNILYYHKTEIINKNYDHKTRKVFNQRR